MFEESVAGKEYDPERWGQYYKPAGMRFNADPTAEGGEPAAKPATKPSVKPVVAAAAVTATPPWADEEDDALLAE